MQDPAKYAKVAGLEVQKFSKMLKEDANGALLMFLESLQQAGGMDVLSPMFKDMGENGSRAIAALSTLATHIDEVKAQQLVANEAFREAVSIDKEFDVQNNTVQAGLDKCKKAAQEIRVELGQRLQPVMEHLLSSTSAMMRALLTTINFLFENKTAILSAALAVGVFTAAVKAETIAMSFGKGVKVAVNAVSATYRTTLLLLASAVNIVRGNTVRATAAWKLFNASLSTSVLGAVIAVLGFAIGKFASYISKVNEASKAERERRKELRELSRATSDLTEATQKNAQKEISALKALYSAATDETGAKKKRIEAAERLISLYPDQFKNMNKEDIMLGRAREKYDALTKSILANAKAKAAAELYQENQKKLLELEIELESNRTKYHEADDKIKETDAKNEKHARELNAVNIIPMNAHSTMAIQGAMSHPVDRADEARKDRREAGKEIDKIKEEQKVIRESQKILEKNNAEAIKSIQLNEAMSAEPADNTSVPVGYTSKVQAEKEKKKADAAARAAAVKAKKEFKEQLDQIKAARDKEQTEIMALRMTGEINYLEYNKRKLDADKKYYDESIALYEKWGIEEDDECQALARKREEFLNKANEQRLALNKEAIQRVAQAEERDLKARYDNKSSHTLAEELRLEEDILKIRYNALKDQQELYRQSDKEYEEYQRQIDELFLKDQEAKQKKLLAKVEEFRKKFDYQPIKEKYDMERAALEELYKRKKIKEEEYRKWLKKLNEQQVSDEKKDKENLPGMQKPQNPSSKAAAAQEKYEKQKKELDEALADGRIDESEYQTALRRIGAELRKTLISPLQECKSEWVSLMSTMIESWAEFSDALKDPDGDPFGAMSSAIEATAAIATSVMSMVTEFQKAEYEIQAAEVKKRYDAEMDAAQGNSYRIRQLERDQEKELANLKNEQSRKQFAQQVFAVVAQTAANAVQAFGAGLSVGGLAGLILAPIAAAMAVAQGAVQIALIKKQQQASAAQGYSKGGFTKPGAVDEPAGIVHAGEWVASQKLLANPVARPMIDALDYAQRTNTIGSLRTEDVSRSIRATDSMVRMTESDDSSALVVAAIAHNAEIMTSLNERLKHPIDAAVSIAGDHGVAQAEDK